MQRLLLIPALLTLFIASAKAESTCNEYGVCKTNDTYDPDLYNEDEAKKQLELPESSSEQQGNHEKCIDAADYKGCMEFHSQSREEESSPIVPVSGLDPHSYEKTSVMQLKIRGEYGRYLTFIGRTSNTYSGTSGHYNPGSPGTVRCNTYGGYTSCTRSGYIAPSYTPGRPGGIQHRRYRYQLDCIDRTFNREGDLATAGGMRRGWMSVNDDPTAFAVEQNYCPIIDSLPRAIEKKSTKKKRGQFDPSNR